MVYWQYNINSITLNDGTVLPIGFINCSVPNALPQDSLDNALDGNGNSRPIGQIEGIEFADYNDYTVDLTQNPPTLVNNN